MKTPRFVRTTSFRLVALYAGLFAASTATLFGIVYWVTGDVLYEQLRLSLQNEMTSLEARSAKEGSRGLAVAIEETLSLPSRQPFYYSLQDPSGGQITGNLTELDNVEGWRELPYSDERGAISASASNKEDDDDLLALGRRFRDGSFLTIATNLYPVREAEEAIVRSFRLGRRSDFAAGLNRGRDT